MRLKIFWLIICGVIFLDQLTKFLVLQRIFIHFPIVKNPGLPFGINLPGFFNLFVVLGLFAAFVIITQISFADNFRFSAGYALVIGGALSNIFDRLTRGAAIDFLNFGLSTANVADLAIIIGTVLLIQKSKFKSQN